MTPLFPQANSSQSALTPWPGTDDANQRMSFASLEPTDPGTVSATAADSTRFNFAQLDDDISQAAAAGRRYGFRFMSFDSSNPSGVALPGWLAAMPGVVSHHMANGIDYAVPNWDSPVYLDYLNKLIVALGHRYDGDERVSWYEFSGYGDFSENHMAFARDTLKMVAPSTDELGYAAPYGDQFITKASIASIVNTTLTAFHRTQVVTASGNAQVMKDLLRDSPALAHVAKPVGLRSDCIGTFDVMPSWATDPNSPYAKNNDPIVTVMANRYKTAPIITEWCNWMTASATTYYQKGLLDSINAHVSMVSSTGFPGQFDSSPMNPGLYDLLSRTEKYVGYRYSASISSLTAPRNGITQVSAQWVNSGTAPAYDLWKPMYVIRNRNGAVVRTSASRINLKSLYGSQAAVDPAQPPRTASQSVVETMYTAGLAKGTYTVAVSVTWSERKAAATKAWRTPPMALAQSGRDASGGYPLGSFTVA